MINYLKIINRVIQLKINFLNKIGQVICYKIVNNQQNVINQTLIINQI